MQTLLSFLGAYSKMLCQKSHIHMTKCCSFPCLYTFHILVFKAQSHGMLTKTKPHLTLLKVKAWSTTFLPLVMSYLASRKWVRTVTGAPLKKQVHEAPGHACPYLPAGRLDNIHIIPWHLQIWPSSDHQSKALTNICTISTILMKKIIFESKFSNDSTQNQDEIVAASNSTEIWSFF